MIIKIKKLIFGKVNARIDIAQCADEEISYFRILHPFLTRREINRLLHKFHEEIIKKDGIKYRLVFEEKPTFFERLKFFFNKKSQQK